MELRERVRAMVASGRLVWPVGQRVATGFGEGSLCLVCEAAITADRRRFVFTSTDRRTSVHRECFIIWVEEMERRSNGAARPQSRRDGQS